MRMRYYIIALGIVSGAFASRLAYAESAMLPYETSPELFDSFETCLPAARVRAQGDNYTLEKCERASASPDHSSKRAWICTSSQREGTITGCGSGTSTERHHALESGRTFICQSFKHPSGREMVALYMSHAYSKAFSASVYNARDVARCRSAVWQSDEMSRFYDLCPARIRENGLEPTVVRARDVIATGGSYFFGRNAKPSTAPPLSSRPEKVSTITYLKESGGKTLCDYAAKPTQKEHEEKAALSSFSPE